jgi:hypothetical protein
MESSVRSMIELAPPAGDADQSRTVLREVLSVMRSHLGMEVAFISRVDEDRRVFEHVDSDPWFSPVAGPNASPGPETRPPA